MTAVQVGELISYVPYHFIPDRLIYRVQLIFLQTDNVRYAITRTLLFSSGSPIFNVNILVRPM